MREMRVSVHNPGSNYVTVFVNGTGIAPFPFAKAKIHQHNSLSKRFSKSKSNCSSLGCPPRRIFGSGFSSLVLSLVVFPLLLVFFFCLEGSNLFIHLFFVCVFFN